MTKRTIAPVLSALLEDLHRKAIRYPLSQNVGDLQVLRVARDELRRVTSVVRAAGQVSADTAGDPLVIEHLCALDRALARLRGGGRAP